MPILKNSRHERFAQEVAKGKSADDAYTLCGNKPHRGNASRMRTKESVRRRIEELQAKGAEKAGVTIERIITEMAKAAFGDVEDAPRWVDKLGALEKLGKYLGMFKEQVEARHTIEALRWLPPSE